MELQQSFSLLSVEKLHESIFLRQLTVDDQFDFLSVRGTAFVIWSRHATRFLSNGEDMLCDETKQRLQRDNCGRGTDAFYFCFEVFRQ